MVRAKSKVIVADILEILEINYQYKQPLFSRPDAKDFRLPDFTVSFEGDVHLWKHLAMLTVPSHHEACKRKRKMVRSERIRRPANSVGGRADGGIDSAQFEHIARERVLDDCLK